MQAAMQKVTGNGAYAPLICELDIYLYVDAVDCHPCGRTQVLLRTDGVSVVHVPWSVRSRGVTAERDLEVVDFGHPKITECRSACWKFTD